MKNLLRYLTPIVLIFSCFADAAPTRPGTIYPDLGQALLHIDQNGAQFLAAVLKDSELECRSRLHGAKTLAAVIEQMEKVPERLHGFCLLPSLVNERERMIRVFKSASGPMEFANGFDPIDLKTGWWNEKPFQETADPAEALLQWIVINEALHRALLETRELASSPYAPYSAVSLPLIIAHLTEGAPALKIKAYLESSVCPPQQVACAVAHAKLVDTFNQVIDRRRPRLHADVEAIRDPIPGAVDPEINTATAVLAAETFLHQLREKAGSSLDLIRSLPSATGSEADFRDLLFALGEVPKDLSNTQIAQALQAALALSALDDVVVGPKLPDVSSETRFAEQNIALRTDELKKNIDTSVLKLLTQLESLLNLRLQGMEN